MKKFEVELSITKTFTTKVIIEGDFQDMKDPAIKSAAEQVADNMDHERWDYNDTVFEIYSLKELPEHFSADHIHLLRAGYSLSMVKSFSKEDVEAQIGAIADSL
ncbi:hypothetical protein M670_00150 [Schinkia azotoformans MEV2011]|uniref:Uncharacterized protein n=1 Tax=Schinkia azotoformans MEV2011 TaxID=1348973 RepID=A0A072NR56_SCHAZ|nr:hypothetical protein [Schinkia azotoformans]KEF40134.1 hypothetical protein M670_00150 [Schinkia azotoformans MEV2011]MEC1714731.1 hypothetical protein [Schinkia azotoformans]MEC1757513.1 hypothetical protein [Schinkia azotoformans]